jgi:2-polyprenyl-6-methoxyphenol hydroxylase-like FAD-dependent oxidoreductase
VIEGDDVLAATDHSSDIVIAGAGPVGLALAIDLGLRGVKTTVVEPRDRSRLVPRAKLTNVRSMEHMRRWGVADRVRNASPLPASFSTDIAFVTSLVGREITRFTNAFYTEPKRDDRFAEPAQQIPQYVTEPVLREYASEIASISFVDGWRVADALQDEVGVKVSISQGPAGPSRVIHARFLVGCDGAGSTVREIIGASLRGRRAIATNYGVVFRSAELSRLLPFKPALHFWTLNASTPSYMGPGDTVDLWWLQATALPFGTDMKTLDPVNVVEGATGMPIHDIEILSVDPWEAHALTADRVIDGRIILAGDAAHMHTPMGAHGMNQGIGDAADLGWKLWGVLSGWASPAVLQSYAMERGPVHERVVAEATHNYSRLANHFVRKGLEVDGPQGDRARAELAEEIQREKRREFFSLGLILGHVHKGSPIVVDAESSADVNESIDEFTSALRVGGRAPHAWLADGTSLFDHFGPGFTLMRTGASTGDGLMIAAADRGIPLEIVTVHEPTVTDLYGESLTLIRPDQVVAWNATEEPGSRQALLDVVTGHSIAAAGSGPLASARAQAAGATHGRPC